MSQYLFISDAAKEVKVESHVLRYWEEELHLPIKRNELGHRYYTQEDVERFKQIKGMKERGLQLKAIKMILKDGKLDMLVPKADRKEGTEAVKEGAKEARTDAAEGRKSNQEEQEQPVKGDMPIEIVEEKETAVSADSKADKSRRLQWLLQQLIRETLQENNGELCREIKESVVKELDYQFRMQEEREEARDRLLAERDEEHYKKMDELLRKKSRRSIKKEAERERAEREKIEREKADKAPVLQEKPQKEEKKKKRFIF